MKVFVSYSRRDEAVVRSLVADLVRARVDVWLDEELVGGESWWTTIVQEIRDCTVFVLALSDNSLSSKPCRAELEYGRALERPILPVQVGPVENYRSDWIFSKQLIDYQQTTASTGFALMGALHSLAAQPAPLPEPLPEAPPIPYEYLQRLGSTVQASGDLAATAQRAAVFELRAALDEESDPSVQAEIRNLLRKLGERTDVTAAVAREIDTVLPPTTTRQVAPPPPQPPEKPKPPPRKAERPRAQREPSTSPPSSILRLAGFLFIVFAVPGPTLMLFTTTPTWLTPYVEWGFVASCVLALVGFYLLGRYALTTANDWICAVAAWIVGAALIALCIKRIHSASTYTGGNGVYSEYVASQRFSLVFFVPLIVFGLIWATRQKHWWAWIAVVASVLGLLVTYDADLQSLELTAYVALAIFFLTAGISMVRQGQPRHSPASG